MDKGSSDDTPVFPNMAQATLSSRKEQGLRTGHSQSANRWLPEPHGL